MSIEIGQNAPEIELYKSDKTPFKLSDYRGKNNVLLLFFPAVFTGTCTTELNMVNDDIAGFGSDTVVVGISTDSPFSQAEFKKANAFTFDLLSDHNASVCADYGSKYDNNFTAMNLDRIARRSAFVVGKDGIIKYAEVLESAGDLPDLDAVQRVLKEL